MFGSKVKPVFLVVAPAYTYTSAGVRALYRLCHHLNAAGYPSAMMPMGAGYPAVMMPMAAPLDFAIPANWINPIHTGPVADSIVVYPEVVSGNPLNADKVVRWALNSPGLLGGDKHYADEEMVFAFNPERLAVVSQAVSSPLGPSRVLNVAVIDPKYIFPDPTIEKAIDCYFTYKGKAVRERARLANESELQSLEALTPSLTHLGDVLRRTRTLYSYDHASTVLKEAVICGCRVLVVHDDGRLLDPATCGCAYNVNWHDGFRETYAQRFDDSSFVDAFVQELATRWPLPPARKTRGRPDWFRLRDAFARIMRRN